MRLVVLCILALLMLTWMLTMALAQAPVQPAHELAQTQTQVEMLKASRDFSERFASQVITAQGQQLKECQEALGKTAPKPEASAPVPRPRLGGALPEGEKQEETK